MELEATNQTKQTVQEYNDKIVTTTRYGIIKLMGDKKQYEIDWATYQKLKNLPVGFSGLIEIKELDMTVPLSQITLLTSGERSETQFKAFVSLPTERIELDTDFNIIHGLKREIEGKYSVYYSALCHYNEVDGKRQYLIDKNRIKELVLMKKDDYGFCVSEIWRYGQKVI